jgi:hypothetical protein
MVLSAAMTIMSPPVPAAQPPTACLEFTALTAWERLQLALTVIVVAACA